MPFTTYEAAIRPTISALNSLSHILSQAKSHPNSAGFPTARLHPDMKPLCFQVNGALQASENLLSRLTGCEPFVFPEDDLPMTFEEMLSRINVVRGYLLPVQKDEVNECGASVSSEKVRVDGQQEQVEVKVSGVEYVTATALPDLLFHVSMAFAILGKEGVELHQGDYSNSFARPLISQ